MWEIWELNLSDVFFFLVSLLKLWPLVSFIPDKPQHSVHNNQETVLKKHLRCSLSASSTRHFFSSSTRVQWSRQPWTTLCPCSLPAWWARSPSRWTICPWAPQEVWVLAGTHWLGVHKTHVFLGKKKKVESSLDQLFWGIDLQVVKAVFHGAFTALFILIGSCNTWYYPLTFGYFLLFFYQLWAEMWWASIIMDNILNLTCIDNFITLFSQCIFIFFVTTTHLSADSRHQ